KARNHASSASWKARRGRRFFYLTNPNPSAVRRRNLAGWKVGNGEAASFCIRRWLTEYLGRKPTAVKSAENNGPNQPFLAALRASATAPCTGSGTRATLS